MSIEEQIISRQWNVCHEFVQRNKEKERETTEIQNEEKKKPHQNICCLNSNL